MAKATVEQLKDGITILTNKANFGKDYKAIHNENTFTKVYGDLGVWLEDKNLEATAILVAQVINQYFASKFDFGQLKKIGTFSCATLTPLVVAAPLTATYTDLKATYVVGTSDYIKVRAEVARVLAIDDKTHSAHGSNFKGTQSLEQIITNVCAPVKGLAEIARMKGLVRSNYKLNW
ncbi:hypothetical protein [Granulicella arctica]|uniref:hypothetical protein n=1 Tax=Granulicella arctica TaxID=940613 RepID=UPI0021E0F04A|nr:hypothetical protein [Granulicella arctica]